MSTTGIGERTGAGNTGSGPVPSATERRAAPPQPTRPRSAAPMRNGHIVDPCEPGEGARSVPVVRRRSGSPAATAPSYRRNDGRSWTAAPTDPVDAAAPVRDGLA